MRVVGLQAGCVLVLAVPALFWEAALAVLLGGLAVVLPNGYFAWASAPAGDGENLDSLAAQREAGRFFARWLVKIALVVTLLGAVLASLDVAWPWFFSGLGVALLAPVASPLLGWPGAGGLE